MHACMPRVKTNIKDALKLACFVSCQMQYQYMLVLAPNQEAVMLCRVDMSFLRPSIHHYGTVWRQLMKVL